LVIISQRDNTEEGKVKDEEIKNFKIEDIRFNQPVENEFITNKEIQKEFKTGEITFKITWWKKDSYIISFLVNDSPTIVLSKEELEELLKQTQPIERVKAETNEKTSDTLQ